MIIAIANQKGGVGKTTLTVHLGKFLASRGYRVALVDADPQGNTSSWLLDGETATATGMFEMLVVGTPAVKLALDTPGWPLRLLSGNNRTGEAFIFLSATGKPFDALAQHLRPLCDLADFVLIDTPPSRNAGFAETLFAADLVLVPTQLERHSLEGVVFMAQICRELTARHGHGPRLLGIVPNMTRRQTNEHRQQMEELVGEFGTAVWPPIPLSVHVAEACAFGRTVFDDPQAGPVVGALQLVGERLLDNARVG
jgi:chromosome partitioning protein